MIQHPVVIDAVQQPIIVNGKSKTVFNLIYHHIWQKGDDFNVILNNKTTVPISVHWHGLIDPNNQDGVPYVTQLPIKPGDSKHYDFKLVQSGTYWMHSHYKFHAQDLMAAPLIIDNPNSIYKKDKSVVMMLEDFSFKTPKAIYEKLRHSKKMIMSKGPDLNDVKYDAFLTNRQTLENPDVVRVIPGETVRLRIIDGASASNFWVDTGKLKGTIIAADGEDVKPIENKVFQIALGQRLDVLVKIPKGRGVYPILAQVEGTNQQTGLILATMNAKIPHYSETAKKMAPALNNNQEEQLHAIHPLENKPVNQILKFVLKGNMKNYTWTINNQAWPHITPSLIKKGERVEMDFINDTGMSHPMHFHGHVFEVTYINGKKITDGALRDTLLVLPHETDKVVFDADNPGIWMLHCHVLYHQVGGMATTVNYVGYPEPEFYKQLIKPA